MDLTDVCIYIYIYIHVYIYIYIYIYICIKLVPYRVMARTLWLIKYSCIHTNAEQMFDSIVLTEANSSSETMMKTTRHNDRTHCSYLCDFMSTLCEKVPSDIVQRARLRNYDINRSIVYSHKRITVKGILDQTRPMIRQTKLADVLTYIYDIVHIVSNGYKHFCDFNPLFLLLYM